MNKNNNKTILTYEENQKLQNAIRSILAEHTSDKEKRKKLYILQSSTQTPLGKDHVAWYINQLNARKLERYKRIISILILSIWLIYILCRTYLFFHPELYNINSILGLTLPSEAVVHILLTIPTVILIYYIIIYILSSKDATGNAD